MPAVDMPIQRPTPSTKPSQKPIILHLGDPIEYNHELHKRLDDQFQIIRPSASDLQRPNFLNHLRNKTWGEFVAIMRPFWKTGNEMKPWDKELIELLPKGVKVYASAGAGYDWVDIESLAEHGIIYCNSRGASTEAVADMALYYIISVFRCMTHSHLAARSLNQAKFNDAHFNLPLISHNPRGHTLGIIGLGDIGFTIARKVRAALGMKILYNDINRKSEAQEKEVSATFYPNQNRNDMLHESDCVLIATPFAGERLVTASLLSHFKPGSRLVNIARGSLVDEEALADALEQGRLTAVGMDVHASEPAVSKRLAEDPKVHMTCHTGGGTLETNVNFERLSMENVDAVLNGKEPLTAVNAHLIRRKDDCNGHVTNGEQHTDDDMTNGHPNGAGHMNGGRMNGTNLHVQSRTAQAPHIATDVHTSIIGGV